MGSEGDDDLKDSTDHQTPSPAQLLRHDARPQQAQHPGRLVETHWWGEKTSGHFKICENLQIQETWYTSRTIPVGLEVNNLGRAMVKKALTQP